MSDIFPIIILVSAAKLHKQLIHLQGPMAAVVF